MKVTALTHKVTGRDLTAKSSMRREMLTLLNNNSGKLSREEIYTLDKLLAIAKVRLIEQH